MALLDDILGVAGYVADVLLTPSRSIGFLIPNVVMEEIHRDELAIVQHPVETGATITDHAFKLPAQVEMRIGFSDSGQFPGYSKAVYAALLSLQLSRVPMSVSTGKRSYSNMLLAGLTTVTDQKTENALMIACRLQEINLVSVQTTSTGSSGAASPGAGATNADLAAGIADPVNSGSKQLAQASFSPGGV